MAEALSGARAQRTLFVAFALATVAANADATASSTQWTNTAPGIQGFGVGHLGVDDYFTVAQHGGAAVGLYTYFTPDIALAVAPVWFHGEGVNGEWKVTVQLDIDLPSLAP